MISSLLPEHYRQGREHALVFSVEASLNFLSRPYTAHVVLPHLPQGCLPKEALLELKSFLDVVI
jgi:hypothetical protein